MAEVTLTATTARLDTASALRSRVHAALAVTATATLLLMVSGPQGAGAALVVVALVAYAALMRLESRARALTGSVVLAVSGALLVGAVVVPPRASEDSWAYAIYGRMVALHHSSPYRHVPAELSSDPVFPRVSETWHAARSVYGPAFTALSAAGMWVFRSPLGIRLFFQLVSAAAMFGILLLLWRRTRSPAAVAFVGLHPITAASVVNGGHNDALVGLAVLAGVLLFLSRRDSAAGAVIALGALVKVLAVIPLVALVWWAWRRRGRRAALSVAGAGGAVLVGGYAVAGGGALSALVENARHVTAHAVARLFDPSVTGPAEAARVVRVSLVAAILLAGALVVAYERRGSLVSVVGGSLFAYLLLGAYVLPWYASWVLPVLALRRSEAPARAAALLGGLLMLGYWLAVLHPTAGAIDLVERAVRRVFVPAAAILIAGWLLRTSAADRRTRISAPT